MLPNRYPLWKNLLLIILVVLGILYAAPNLFGDTPAVQISATDDAPINQSLVQQITSSLATHQLKANNIEVNPKNILLRFPTTDQQLAAKDLLKNTLGDNYTAALNLAPATPAWLRSLGAHPMKLGLDLRGGIHFTLDVDMDGVMAQRTQGLQRNIMDSLRDENIRYSNIISKGPNNLLIQFRDKDNFQHGLNFLRTRFQELQLTPKDSSQNYQIFAQITPNALDTIRQNVIDQTMTTLRNRVNELGISEATVQQAGSNRITIEMPGVLDTAHAKQILGGTATLELHMVDTEHDPRLAATEGDSLGSKIYMFDALPVLLKNQVILSGNSITNAQASFDENGRPAVDITLGGGGEALFHQTTAMNIGKPMAIVYIESKVRDDIKNGVPTKVRTRDEKVISVATIRSALNNNFQITGLRNVEEAQNLALLLRAGALPATVSIVEEKTLGPKLGMENIKKGILSVEIAMLIVIVFMAFYYGIFGLIADLALVINMVLLVALLSLLGMTLTLPGIAGIVLTVGMAVDANVLIFERIREELRNGTSPQASINAGYERAFTTIVDANVTTLIVALVLFGVGTGAVKGFAVTLSIGILTSMISAIAITRALVNYIYGCRHKKLSIGI